LPETRESYWSRSVNGPLATGVAAHRLYQGLHGCPLHIQEVVMKRFSLLGRLAVIVASAGALLAISAGALPAAMAGVMTPLGGAPHGRPGVPAPQLESGGGVRQPSLPTQAHGIGSGMPGWQIVLIAAGAALLCAALAMIVYRARAARRRMNVSVA
jgi:hypothetical protein